MHYVHKKARCGPEIATFRTKTLHFCWLIRLNWLATIELRKARGPWCLILLLVTVVRKKCWKEIETEEIISVFGEISIGGRVLWTPTPWLHLCSKWGKQNRCSQFFREVSGVFQQNFNGSKNSAVLEPKKEKFSRTWGFKATAKDLTFEAKAKAKDFKIVLEDVLQDSTSVI